MKKSDKPSEYFIGAILRGYDREAQDGEVTCSGIWDHIVMECLQRRDGFLVMFDWDTSTAQNKNRIRTIAECIRRGHVPTLSLAQNARGRDIVVKEE